MCEIASVEKRQDITNNLSNAIPLKYELYLNKNYNNLRRCKILLFSHIFAKYDKFKTKSYDEKHDIITELERSCYHAAIDKAHISEDLPKYWSNPQFEGLYNNICFNFICNVDPDSEVNSTYLGNEILENRILPECVGYLTSREMCPEKYVEFDANLNKRSNSTSTMKTTELYKCFKCKKNQCILENVVNRSIDEGTSLVVHCLFCGNSWGG